MAKLAFAARSRPDDAPVKGSKGCLAPSRCMMDGAASFGVPWVATNDDTGPPGSHDVSVRFLYRAW